MCEIYGGEGDDTSHVEKIVQFESDSSLYNITLFGRYWTSNIDGGSCAADTC